MKKRHLKLGPFLYKRVGRLSILKLRTSVIYKRLGKARIRYLGPLRMKTSGFWNVKLSWES